MLLILDVSTPTAPVLQGEVGVPDMIQGVSIAGGYSNVAASDAGLRVADLSSPAGPIEIGAYNTPGNA